MSTKPSPKKANTPAAKSPAPATKSAEKAGDTAKSAAKRTAKKSSTPKTNGVASVAIPAPVPAAPFTVPAATPAKPAATAPAGVPAAAKTTSVPVKPVETKPVVTTIAARVDVGFGNTLYLRGDGPGLNWDRGVAMDCVGTDQWQLTLGESARPYAVKFLINDTTWSTGPDYIVPSGVNVTLAPQF